MTGEVKNVAVHPSVNKRNYSQADLDAAVRDIRCGRLGTRRASVVYGIPRSFSFHFLYFQVFILKKLEILMSKLTFFFL